MLMLPLLRSRKKYNINSCKALQLMLICLPEAFGHFITESFLASMSTSTGLSVLVSAKMARSMRFLVFIGVFTFVIDFFENVLRMFLRCSSSFLRVGWLEQPPASAAENCQAVNVYRLLGDAVGKGVFERL